MNAVPTYRVGQILTFESRFGTPPEKAEFRGWHMHAETGEKVARVIVRPEAGPWFETSVLPSELS